MRVVQVANYVTDRSGGQRRALSELGRRYVAAGHTCTLVVPGERRSLRVDEGVAVVTLPGTPVPASGGYRTILRRKPLQRLLVGLGPDVVELSDKTTLSWLPGWLRAAGVPTVLLVHERHDELLAGALPGWLPWREVVRGWAGRAAGASVAVVCPSRYAAAQFDGVDAPVMHVPLGVDLETFRPPAVPARRAGAARLAYVGRLSPEKRPDLAVAVLADLIRRGVPATLGVYGDGPRRDELALRSLGLPVELHGRVDDRAALAAAIGTADVAIAPCPVEAFGLAIVEAMACGTPVVVTDRGAARELIAAGTGTVAAVKVASLADGVVGLLAGDRGEQAVACRRHAEQYSWERTAAAMLATFHRARADHAPRRRAA